MPAEKIILIGFMGSGKSSVAINLANALNYEMAEADKLIIEASGCKNISEIFELKGETYFRDIETQVAESLKDSRHVVISTGGGVIGRPQNMAYLTANGGFTVFLDVALDEVFKRVRDVSNRPLLGDPAQARRLYEERLPVYRSYADLIIKTDNKTASEITDEIIKKLS
jgi:shikimate kinase